MFSSHSASFLYSQIYQRIDKKKFTCFAIRDVLMNQIDIILNFPRPSLFFRFDRQMS